MHQRTGYRHDSHVRAYLVSPAEQPPSLAVHSTLHALDFRPLRDVASDPTELPLSSRTDFVMSRRTDARDMK